jgi:hypothetical protein
MADVYQFLREEGESIVVARWLILSPDDSMLKPFQAMIDPHKAMFYIDGFILKILQFQRRLN